MSQTTAVNPNTPIVVKLKGGDTVCMPAAHLAAIKPLAERVKQIRCPPPTASDSVPRGFLDLEKELTMQELCAVLSRVYNGPFDPRTFSLMHNYELLSEADRRQLLTMCLAPAAGLDSVRKDCSSGALISLVARGRESAVMQSLGGQSVQATFENMRKIQDAPYTVGLKTFDFYNSDTNKDFHLVVSRAGDMAHTLVLKAIFSIPPNTTVPEDILDEMFDSVKYEIGGQKEDSIRLSVNNRLAKARKLWPTRGNTVPSVSNVSQTWIATVPIMLSETEYYKDCAMPLLCTHFSEFYLTLEGSNRVVEKLAVSNIKLEFLLDADFVYLDTPTRRGLARANMSEHGSSCSCCDQGAAKPSSAAVTDVEMSASAAATSAATAWNATANILTTWDATATASASAIAATTTNAPVPVLATTAVAQKVNSVVGAATTTKNSKDGNYCDPNPVPSCYAHMVSKQPAGEVYAVTRHISRDIVIPPSNESTTFSVKRFGEGCCSGIIVMLKPTANTTILFDRATLDRVVPVVSADLLVNQQVAISCDAVDLTEFNWIKTGMEPPRDNLSLLLPFSREMFEGNVMPCTVDLGRMENVEIKLKINGNVAFLGWNVTVTAYANGKRRFSDGAIAPREFQC